MDGQLLCDSERDIFTVRYGLQFVCFKDSLYLNKLTVNPCGHLVKNPLMFLTHNSCSSLMDICIIRDKFVL